eukprot:11801229-Ditylum_brightwellii.AAC.1
MHSDEVVTLVEMDKDRLLGPSTQVMSRTPRVLMRAQAPQGLMMSALVTSPNCVASPNADKDKHLRKEALGPLQVGTMANMAPSVEDSAK